MRMLPVFVMVLATIAAESAFAHAELTQSVPADQATVAAAPRNLALKFSEPVRLTALTLQKGDAPKQELGPLPAAAAKDFALALPETLGEGRYLVTWRALSDDTHVMSGELTFTVGAAAGADAHAGHDAAPAAATHDALSGAH